MLLVLRENGMGFSGAVLSVPQMTKTLKVIIAIEIAYYLCVNAVKISIVFFYLRIGEAGSRTGTLSSLMFNHSC